MNLKKINKKMAYESMEIKSVKIFFDGGKKRKYNESCSSFIHHCHGNWHNLKRNLGLNCLEE